MPTYYCLDWKDISKETVSAVIAMSKHVMAEGGTRPHVANVKHLSEFILRNSKRYPLLTEKYRNPMSAKNIKTRCTYGLVAAGWDRWTIKSSGGKGMKFIIPWASDDKNTLCLKPTT